MSQGTFSTSHPSRVSEQFTYRSLRRASCAIERKNSTTRNEACFKQYILRQTHLRMLLPKGPSWSPSRPPSTVPHTISIACAITHSERSAAIEWRQGWFLGAQKKQRTFIETQDSQFSIPSQSSRLQASRICMQDYSSWNRRSVTWTSHVTRHSRRWKRRSPNWCSRSRLFSKNAKITGVICFGQRYTKKIHRQASGCMPANTTAQHTSHSDRTCEQASRDIRFCT
jgi:hypothetical protein